MSNSTNQVIRLNRGNGNQGRFNIGDRNQGDGNIGNDNVGNGNIGNNNVGNYNFGTSITGTGTTIVGSFTTVNPPPTAVITDFPTQTVFSASNTIVISRPADGISGIAPDPSQAATSPIMNSENTVGGSNRTLLLSTMLPILVILFMIVMVNLIVFCYRQRNRQQRQLKDERYVFKSAEPVILSRDSSEKRSISSRGGSDYKSYDPRNNESGTTIYKEPAAAAQAPSNDQHQRYSTYQNSHHLQEIPAHSPLYIHPNIEDYQRRSVVPSGYVVQNANVNGYYDNRISAASAGPNQNIRYPSEYAMNVPANQGAAKMASMQPDKNKALNLSTIKDETKYGVIAKGSAVGGGNEERLSALTISDSGLVEEPVATDEAKLRNMASMTSMDFAAHDLNAIIPKSNNGSQVSKSHAGSGDDYNADEIVDLDAYHPPAPTSHVVVSAYFPVRPDEMLLHVGDLMGVEKEYPDGWARGQNISQGRKRCMFPLAVTAPITNGPSQTIVGNKWQGNADVEVVRKSIPERVASAKKIIIRSSISEGTSHS